MNEFYVPRTQKALFGNLTAWVIALVLLGGVIAGSVIGLQTLFARPSGKAGAYRQKESAVNRVQKQEMFEQINADINGYIAKIAVAKQALAAARATADSTDDALRQTDLVGVTQTCIDTVQQYNAESRKYTSRDFKSLGLPFTRDPKECK